MKYSLGLDIGVTSVGWAVVDEDKKRIHDLGVRIFEKAENPKTGESLAKPRRDARSARRRLRRRRQRLDALKRFFIAHNLLDQKNIDQLFSTPNDPYILRVKGLDERLTNQELFLALYHIAKRRGYKSNRKSQELSDAEGKSVLKGIGANQALLSAGGYRTVGEALLKDDRYKLHKRNKRNDYSNSFARDDFLNEMKTLLYIQRQKGLQFTDYDVESLLNAREMLSLPDGSSVEMYYGSFAQRPFMNRELMQRMIGKCTHEPNEPRAPRASYSFELFRFAQDLVNVVLSTKGERRTLTPEEISSVIIKAHENRGIKYKTVRKTLELPDDCYFTYVRGKIKNNNPDENAFGEMKFYHDVKKALKDLPEWQQFTVDPYLLDDIGLVLTVEKTDEDIRRELSKVNLPMSLSNEAIEALLPLSYSKFAAFSAKALKKITPYLLQAQTHDKAVISAGYVFNNPKSSNNHKLPPLSAEDAERITNPVVKRAISQTIKVINAVVRKYGLPYQIKIECARELAKSFKERNDIIKSQQENQENNQKIVDLIKEHGITTPNGQQIIKYKLYRQQNGQCLYSGKPISLDLLFSDDYAYEIDHIVPWSRCGDDSLSNKALVLREENQNKGNALPFEAFSGNEAKWLEFKARVESLNLERGKVRRCLAEKIADKDWSAHALKDTQYITRFMKEYVEKNLAFSDPDKRQKVLLPAGSITSYIGKRWGIGKNRGENVLHHARDAALVAVMTQQFVNRAAQYNKYGEIAEYDKKTKALKAGVDYETGEILDAQQIKELEKQAFDECANTDHHFPRPWPRFDDELKRRVKDISSEDLQNELRDFDNYDEEFRLQVKPIFVSRMPNRKAAGTAHKETLRSVKVSDDQMRTVRMPLSNLKLKSLESSPVRNTDPQLYKTLYDRLNNFNDEPKKAFAEPVYKKDKSGNNAHQVRSIKVASKQPSGFYINNGRAFVNNGSMVRLDVYKKEIKGKINHFFVPVYTHQINGPTPTEILPHAKDFTDIDETFEKIASLYSNDYVKVDFGGKIEEGYYVKYNISSGVMAIIKHCAPGKDRDSLREISPRSTVSIERIDISILGDNAPTQ